MMKNGNVNYFWISKLFKKITKIIWLKIYPQSGLMKKVGRRKKLLAYLKGKDLDRYKALIAKLGLRK